LPKLIDPFLKIVVTEKEARQAFQDKFKAAGWPFATVREFSLVFTPRYAFEFSVVTERGEGDKKHVSEFSMEKGFFNPVLKTIVSEKLNESDLVNEFSLRAQRRIEHGGLTKSDSKKITGFLLSKEKKVPVTSIQFLKFLRYYIPFWEFKVDCNKKQFEIKVNAFTGELIGGEQIVELQQPWGRAVKETVGDLKKPGNWLSYFRESVAIVVVIFRKIFTNRFSKALFHAISKNHSFQLVVLLVLLVFLLFLVFGN